MECHGHNHRLVNPRAQAFWAFLYHALLWTCSVLLLRDKKITLNTLLPSVFMTGVHPSSPQPKSPMWHKREIGVESMFKVVTWLFLALWDIGSSRDLLIITANSNRVALIQCPRHFSSHDVLCFCISFKSQMPSSRLVKKHWESLSLTFSILEFSRKIITITCHS